VIVLDFGSGRQPDRRKAFFRACARYERANGYSPGVGLLRNGCETAFAAGACPGERLFPKESAIVFGPAEPP